MGQWFIGSGHQSAGGLLRARISQDSATVGVSFRDAQRREEVGINAATPAHKTGEITAIAHDAAIVYPPGREPYVLVVLTRGYPHSG